MRVSQATGKLRLKAVISVQVMTVAVTVFLAASAVRRILNWKIIKQGELCSLLTGKRSSYILLGQTNGPMDGRRFLLYKINRICRVKENNQQHYNNNWQQNYISTIFLFIVVVNCVAVWIVPVSSWFTNENHPLIIYGDFSMLTFSFSFRMKKGTCEFIRIFPFYINFSLVCQREGDIKQSYHTYSDSKQNNYTHD